MNTNDNAKRILVYGDSFTFGKIPGGLRFSPSQRYTGILQQELGAQFEVIEEGLRGRVTAGENAFFPHRNGIDQFGPIYGSHVALDLVILQLGTNDTNSGGPDSLDQIVNNFSQYQEKIQWWSDHLGFPMPKIMILAPPVVKEAESYKAFKDLFKGSEQKTKQLPALLNAYSQKHDLFFFDSSTVIVASDIDGVHLDIEENKKLGQALAQYVRSIL